MAKAAAPAKSTEITAGAAGDVGRADAEVDEVTRQLEGLKVQPKRSSFPLLKPQIQRVDTEGRRFVYFDLETTSLAGNCHITQIAACSGEDETFSTFVLPKVPISECAQQLTGITCNGQQMYHHGQPVPCLHIQEALEKFIDFLGKEPAVLLGHNIMRFDCPRLLNALQGCNLVEHFQETVHGFVDTLLLFKDINMDAESYKLTALYQYYTGEDLTSAHDAREDVRAIHRIVDEADPCPMSLLQHSFTLQYMQEMQHYRAKKAELLPAWCELVGRGVVSKYIADKASGSGLSWDDVHLTFQKEGEGPVREMLRDRLTKRKAIIDNICKDLTRAGSQPDKL